ncbi:MAG: hypothetical protein JWO69_1118 [Thermoleophilia bacterium]|nr:hypothetical protein [Thermoleophilia bacterium]
MPRTSEQGFSLVELIVVMVIVAILAAITMMSFGSSKDAANRGKVVAVAQSYDQAIASFALDHTGRMPVPGSRDWPTVTRGPVEPSITVGGAQQPYMRTIPEAVGDGVVAVQTTRPTAGQAKAANTVGTVYVAIGPGAPATQYRIEVWASQKGKLSGVTCVMGNWALAGAKTC